MSDNGRNQITAEASQGKIESGFLGVLSIVALIVLIIGATGSLVFMFRSARNPPPLLVVLFTIWVLFPFVALFWAHTKSSRWSALTRGTLYFVELIVALVSLAIYSGLINVKPAGAANAFLFVAIPPISLLFITIVPITAFVSNKMSRRGGDTQTNH